MLNQFVKNFNQDGEVYLRIKVRPNAAKTCLKEIMADQTVKIDIAAPAVKGRANAELIKFLVQQFATAADNVKIISGAGDRVKLVKIVK